MQFSESWLRTFCNPPLATKELANLLTMSGLEVEELDPAAPAFSGVVVAEILTAVPHPNADRLRVCTVQAGAHSPDGPLQIVCGAPNARPGIKVPLATVGAVLPPGEDGKPFVIGLGKLRGVESRGMLCAADELGLSKDHAGLLELPADAPVGQDIRQYLDLDDQLFTLKLTPNLAHNLSVFGIAREVAALTGSPLLPPEIPVVPASHDRTVPVRIVDTDLCGRFAGRVIRNVDTKVPTPDWMVRRLERSGQRSVSVLVDISNYVMFELGQPNHIFDCDRIKDHLEIRWARPGETLELLSGKQVSLDPGVGVVADAGGVESMAGIMGGESTSVTDATRNIYVEAAFWHPGAIAGRARRFNFSTDASHRFERGVDPQLPLPAIERITALVLAICGGEAGPVTDAAPALPVRQPVCLRVDRAAKVIGMPLTLADCTEVLTRLGLEHVAADGVITVTPPSWRFDLAIEEDLIEEVIRVRGYNTLPMVPPTAPIQAMSRSESRRSTHRLRRAVAALDYMETINFSFVEERWERELAGNDDPIRLLNPIAAPLAVMRSSLIGSLVQVLRHNLARKSASRVRVFELGRVFRRDPAVAASLSSLAGIDQPLRLAGLAYGPADSLQWASPERPVDFYDVKGDVEALLAPLAAEFRPGNHPAMHPGRCAQVLVAGRVIGHVGELHPRLCQGYELPQAPVLFELEAQAMLDRPVPAGRPVPRHQAVQRDLALLVKSGVPAAAVCEAIRRSDAGGVIRSAVVFDVYRPLKAQGDLAADEKSLAIRLELLDDAQPLTDERTQGVINRALEAVATLGGRLRGA